LSEQWLPAAHGEEKGPLRHKVARGLTWTVIDTWGTQILSLIVFTILANLLVPADFGLVALAAVFVAFAQLLVDQGLGDALIQRPSVTRRQIDTAFWTSLLTGIVLTFAGILLSWPIAALLGEPDLQPILMALSFTFIFASLDSIQIALMRRDMRFKQLAVRKLTAVSLGGAVGITLAYLDYGPWALVGQQLVAAIAAVVTLWTVSPWRPGFQFAREDFRSLFSFGINVVAGDILNFFSRNTDNLLIGAYLGVVPLGIYAVGYRILDTSQQLLVNFARKLAFPVFSRLQGDLDRLRNAYARVTRTVGVVILPGYIGLALVAQEAVVVLFGPQWADSGPVASVLFLIGPVLTIQMFSGALLNGTGHPDVTFRTRLITTVVNVAGFFVAVFFFKDILAVAAAYVIRGYLLLPLIMYWVAKYAKVDVRRQLAGLRGSALATIIMVIAVVGVKVVLSSHVHTAVLLLIEVAVGVATFLAALFFLDRPLLKDVTSVALQALPGGARVARRIHVELPEGERERRRRKQERRLGEPVPAEELVTSGASIGAQSIGNAAGGPADEALGDV
jgi:PST family polysaccharide transporter